MSDLAPNPVGRSSATGYSGPTPRAAAPVAAATAPRSLRGNDQVELSTAAQMLSKLNELPEVRQDVVDRVRAEILNGTYETPEKLDAAIEALFEDLA